MIEQELQNIEKIYDLLINFFVNYSFQVIGAFIILIAGMIVSRWISRLLLAFFKRRNVDVTLAHFLANVAKIIVLVIFIVIALGKFGISVAPFVAAIGAVAFGASIALQGPVSNYGAGISIILTRLFRVGDTIKVHEYYGVVHEIKLANTTLETEDGEHIIIPNKKVVGEVLTNSFTAKVVESSVGVAYSSDPEQVINIIKELLAQQPEVVKTPDPQVGIEAFGDSSINIGLRYWIPTQQYYKVQYTINLAIFKALQENKIEIPFPQREVRILGDQQL
ncbi:small-conductance mechanosensitive channel [Oleiphilus messinensis]|uniref:Small-conductance mechanosensitive channel n=1 Tax=Oleiphilus messinensis TaxID=141451 RepID=A0A1Y0IDR4_9GAMM|nr:mechanosensitive ion channel domain-containing protein [Oleiphilus messinensis]ARU57926.1 small-conductance mechanosensitive channel [Oleiphilus messinensis]